MRLSHATIATHVYFRKGRVYNRDPRNTLDRILEHFKAHRPDLAKSLADYPIDKIISIRDCL